MRVPQCEKEQAVTELLQTGRWPDACDAALRSHVESCAVCSEVVLVAGLLQEANSSLLAEVKLPDAGLVWWKAQLRARREAAELRDPPDCSCRKVRLGLRHGCIAGVHGLEAD